MNRNPPFGDQSPFVGFLLHSDRSEQSDAEHEKRSCMTPHHKHDTKIQAVALNANKNANALATDDSFFCTLTLTAFYTLIEGS